MSKSRLEWKVGLFVMIGLGLLAVLLIQFSKGTTFFRPTYDILLRATTVSGLKTRAGVLMSGVQVGTITDMKLAPEGASVTLTLRIYSQFQIRTNAIFRIETSGFLGDQYVAITPTVSQGRFFVNGDTAVAELPFNLNEAVQKINGFIQRMDDTATNLNAAIVDIRRIVLNEQTLSNLSVAVANLRTVSEHAVTTVDNINLLVLTNSPAIGLSGSNLVAFSKQLNLLADGLNGLLATNGPGIHATVTNLEASSATLNELLVDVKAGKGLAGTVLRNDQLATNVSQLAQNLSITSSNLNRLGLWGILWKHKQPKTETATPQPQRIAAPKNQDL